MRRQLRSLRVRLAVTGFAAIYLPTLVLLAVVSISESIEASSTDTTSLETPGPGLPLVESTDVSVSAPPSLPVRRPVLDIRHSQCPDRGFPEGTVGP
jgi:hypothetical protein